MLDFSQQKQIHSFTQVSESITSKYLINDRIRRTVYSRHAAALFGKAITDGVLKEYCTMLDITVANLIRYMACKRFKWPDFACAPRNLWGYECEKPSS